MNVNDKVQSAIEGDDKDNCYQTGSLQKNDKLAKFFEILMQIDQRQKNNQKSR